MKQPELVRFTDGIWVIVGAHLQLEEAQEKFGEEYAGMEDADIESVRQCWVRYEFIGESNCPDDYDDPSPGEALWMLKMQKVRPKGCVRKATVVNYDGR